VRPSDPADRVEAASLLDELPLGHARRPRRRYARTTSPAAVASTCTSGTRVATTVGRGAVVVGGNAWYFVLGPNSGGAPSCSHPQVIHPNQPGQAFQNGECAGADGPERQRPSSAPVEGERKILGTFFPLFFLVFQLHSFPTTGIPPGLAWPARLTCPRLLLPQSQRHATC